MKYHNVLQHNQEDCGAACLASISKYYGRTFTLNRIREAAGTYRSGTTLLGLKQGAEALGFTNVRAVKVTLKVIDERSISLPCIIHWKGNHWVVLYGKRGKKYAIADPGILGIQYLEQKWLLEAWNDGVLLTLEPDPILFLAQTDEQEKIGGLGLFFQRIWYERPLFTQILFLNLVVGLIALTAPLLIQYLTDDVLLRGDTQLLTRIIVVILIMNLIGSSLDWLQANLISHFGQRLELHLILEFAKQILRLPLSYYESRRSGEVTSRLRDIQSINQLISQVLINLPGQFFVAIVSLVFMFFYSIKLTIVATLSVFLMLLSTLIFFPILRQKTQNVLNKETDNQGLLVETFKGAITLKAIAAAPQFWDEFKSRFSSLARVSFSSIQISIANNTSSRLVERIGGIILLWIGSNSVINQELTTGQLLAVYTLNRNISLLIINLVIFADEFVRVDSAAKRLTEVIETPAETEKDSHKAQVMLRSDADITCTNLNFNYAGRITLLENFTLTMPGGKVIALIGESGCGKSTLCKLIAALYPLQSGNIRIGSYNIEDISLDCLRQQVVLVPQDPHFWSRSIIDNFNIIDPQVSFEKIVKACQIAEADEFISDLPGRYQTVLGEYGSNISGGQRQRLTIARAIFNDPPILILDESTSAIDPITETKILNNILQHRQGKTTILISHRSRIIQRADWIVFLDKGGLKIQGTLEELRQQPGDHLNFLTA
ncbi:MAG: peptidase domain-containing ABC transporter [Microcystis aeruginosa LG13-03]|nr:peptidase domain-containing ABC transporter [Microcystis aeruginosa LG13-13]NCR02626.1 peptidase domain-containing ABC transporter [Microcystis aeruginosa LG13-03]NCR60825.1 peptidase domain-containing ABC transporter [Microcystis aeruginosa LG11-05]